MSLLLRWGLPLILTFVMGYFSISWVTNTLSRADRTEVAENQLLVLEETRKTEKERLEETLRIVKQNAAETDARREHWRQAFYNKKNEYEEYTKKWGPNTYPAELN